MNRFLKMPQASQVMRLLIAGGFLVMLAVNLPGHLSYDSVMQLLEGRTRDYVTFNPRVMSFALGVFDSIVPGTGLFVVANSLLLFGSLYLIQNLRPTLSWAGVAVAGLLLLTPQLLIYPAIVWKDVFFASLTVSGFICLAFAARDWDQPDLRWPRLVAAVLLFAIASQARQNALVVLLIAAVSIFLVSEGETPRRRLGWAALVLIVPLILGGGLTRMIELTHNVQDDAFNRGFRILQHYDLVGAAAHDPLLILPELETRDPGISAEIHLTAVPQYSPQRVDTLNHGAIFNRLWAIDGPTMNRAWFGLMLRDPGAYLGHRLEVFYWTLFTPDLRQCLPIHVGNDGPPDKLKSLNLVPGARPGDVAISNYSTWFWISPTYSHAFNALVALAVAGLLMVRRDRVDWVMAGLMVGAVGFSASFLLISLACDYRYLYLQDIAAFVGLIYLAIDFPIKPRRPDPTFEARS